MHFIEADVLFYWFRKGADTHTLQMKDLRTKSMAIALGILIGAGLNHMFKSALPTYILIALSIMTFSVTVYAQVRIWFAGERVSMYLSKIKGISFNENFQQAFLSYGNNENHIAIFDDKGIQDFELDEDGNYAIYLQGKPNVKLLRALEKEYPELSKHAKQYSAFNVEVLSNRQAIVPYRTEISKNWG